MLAEKRNGLPKNLQIKLLPFSVPVYSAVAAAVVHMWIRTMLAAFQDQHVYYNNNNNFVAQSAIDSINNVVVVVVLVLLLLVGNVF